MRNSSCRASWSARTTCSGPYEPRGKVYEGAFENNNTTASQDPVLIDQPLPSDLVVDTIDLPSSGATGGAITVSFTVRNQAGATAEGTWTDSVYLSTDSQWDLGDVLLGKVDDGLVVGDGPSFIQG